MELIVFVFLIILWTVGFWSYQVIKRQSKIVYETALVPVAVPSNTVYDLPRDLPKMVKYFEVDGNEDIICDMLLRWEDVVAGTYKTPSIKKQSIPLAPSDIKSQGVSDTSLNDLAAVASMVSTDQDHDDFDSEITDFEVPDLEGDINPFEAEGNIFE